MVIVAASAVHATDRYDGSAVNCDCLSAIRLTGSDAASPSPDCNAAMTEQARNCAIFANASAIAKRHANSIANR
jgi:hypothetical protein